jgi:hypothetical protein
MLGDANPAVNGMGSGQAGCTQGGGRGLSPPLFTWLRRFLPGRTLDRIMAKVCNRAQR